MNKPLTYLIIILFIIVIILSGVDSYILLKKDISISSKLSVNAIPTSISPTLVPSFIPKLLPSQPKQVKLLFIGDTMLAQTIGDGIKNRHENPFIYVQDFFKNYDYIYANLECNISSPNVGIPALGKPYHFKGPLEALDLLQKVGINIVGLANNHSMDLGKEGFIDELTHLDAKGIKYFGGGKNIDEAFAPQYANVNNINIAFIGVNEIETNYTVASANSAGSAFFDMNRIASSIKKAKMIADVVIITPHWGIEGTPIHNVLQEKYAKAFIDDGADLVIGNHPHIVEDLQQYKGKTIFYALGNFISEAATTGPSKYGKIVEADIDINSKKIVNTKSFGIEINFSFPKIVTGM